MFSLHHTPFPTVFPSPFLTWASARPTKSPISIRAQISEAQDLLGPVLRGLNETKKKKKPLSSRLDKYVRVLRREHCFLLFEELGRGDQWTQCIEVFRWMQKQRWYIADTGVYSKLISVMGRKGQIRMAMWLFSEMQNIGCQADTSVYNALITAHVHSKDKAKGLEKSLRCFEKMNGVEGCAPNIVTYNILLRAFAQAGDASRVNALFKNLEESIISPDIFTFNVVMDAYGKNGMIKEMESVLSRMKSGQLKPDIVTFNLLIDAYGTKQELEKMEQVFKSLLLSNERPTLPTFHSMIINYGKACQREKAEGVFEEMTCMGYTPNYTTYESMIMMYGICACVSRARDVLDDIALRNEVKVSTLNAMLDVYCMNGLPIEADQLFERASAIGIQPDASTYKLLYKAYTKANMKELSDKLLKHMDRDSVIPDKRFFLEALGAFVTAESGSKVVNGPTDTQRSLMVADL
ncbi:hypothetical protein Drorol1_Dr00022021 [Drosera rotundifolia]